MPNVKCGIIYFGYKLYLDCDLGWDDVRVNALGPNGVGFETKSNIMSCTAIVHHSDLSENGQSGKKTSV